MTSVVDLDIDKVPLGDGEGPKVIPSIPDLTKHTLSVLGLTYIVKQPRGSWWKGCCFRPNYVKAVLKNVSLHLTSGQITAVLGNSGSGKTTLLDIIACRTKGQIVGGVYIDDKLMTSQIFRSQAGYVIQADRLLPNLTVRETLTYVAWLKFALAHSTEINAQVNQVMSAMSIRHVADSRIGGAVTRGISGGEKRRVSVAVQLLQDPKVLLLDEPTTGLDSFTARYLVKTLADLAKQYNKILLMTIHQPRSDIVPLLDNVALLSQGELMYVGPSAQVTPHFTSLGHPCPTFTNPLDHYLDLVSVDRRSQGREEETTIRLQRIKNGYFESRLFRSTLSDIHGSCHLQDRLELYDANPLGVPAPPGYFSTMGAIITRMSLNTFRDFPLFMLRFFYLGFYSVFLFLFLFRLQHNPESIQDRIGLLYQSGQVAAYLGLLMAVALFPPLRELFYRDVRDGLYGPLVFINSYIIFIVPFSFISSFVFGTFNYWALGMYPDPSRYGIYVTIVFLLNYSGEILAVLLMGVMNNVNVANSATSLILALTGLLSSGFLRSLGSMPVALQNMAYGTIFKYSSEIFVANEFNDLEMDCADPTYNYTKCLVPNGDVFIDYMYPGAVENMGFNFGMVVVFVFGYTVMAILTYRIVGVRHLH